MTFQLTIGHIVIRAVFILTFCFDIFVEPSMSIPFTRMVYVCTSRVTILFRPTVIYSHHQVPVDYDSDRALLSNNLPSYVIVIVIIS